VLFTTHLNSPASSGTTEESTKVPETWEYLWPVPGDGRGSTPLYQLGEGAFVRMEYCIHYVIIFFSKTHKISIKEKSPKMGNKRSFQMCKNFDKNIEY